MKAFSRQALGRARPGLYRRGATLSFSQWWGVSGNLPKPSQARAVLQSCRSHTSFYVKAKNFTFAFLLKKYEGVSFFFLKGDYDFLQVERSMITYLKT